MTDSEGITNAKQKQNTLNCKEYPHIECDPGAELTRQTEELRPLLVMHFPQCRHFTMDGSKS